MEGVWTAVPSIPRAGGRKFRPPLRPASVHGRPSPPSREPRMLIAIAVLVAVVVLFAIVTYNGLVRLRLQTQNAWSDIDVQLKRRHDLVPNLVETVKGYAAHERTTLDSVTQARTAAVAARSAGPAERAAAEAQLSTALQGLTVAVEAYPQLQASGGFRDLQQQLAGIE